MSFQNNNNDEDKDDQYEDSNSSLNVTYEETSNKPNEIINFSDDNSNSSQPNQNLLSLNLATMDTINEDLSDSGYINRNLESNLDEIFDGLNFFISNEKKKIQKEKENLSKTLQNFVGYSACELSKIEKEKERLKYNTRIAHDMLCKPDDIIELDIGGKKQLTTTRQTLTKYPNSALAKLFNGTIIPTEKSYRKGKFFIDRDDSAFENVLYYLRNKKPPYFKDTLTHQLFLDELEHWQIPYTEPHKPELSRKL